VEDVEELRAGSGTEGVGPLARTRSSCSRSTRANAITREG
jgi:hypothetical protein